MELVAWTLFVSVHAGRDVERRFTTRCRFGRPCTWYVLHTLARPLRRLVRGCCVVARQATLAERRAHA